jgi:hypothetical protein
VRGTGDANGDDAPCLRVNGLRSHRRRRGGLGVGVGSAGGATSVTGAVARVSLRPPGSLSAVVVAFGLGSVCLPCVPVLVGSADTG